MSETFVFSGSSNVAACTYDEGEQTLDVSFHGGDTYRYYDVPQTTYRSFTLSPSPGRFVHSRLTNGYSYERI